MDDGAGGISHPEEDVGEPGVVFDNVLGEGPQALIEGSLRVGIFHAHRHRRSGGGGEQGEGIGAFGIR